MQAPVLAEQSGLDWSVAARPISGQSVSGDLHVIKLFENRILVAVIDGVGHGDEAAAAARRAAEVLDSYAVESAISLVKLCHEALLKTRGVVLTVAKLNTAEHTMTWLGVGNVEGRLLRAASGASHPRESVLLRGGLVGYQLPALQAGVIPLAAGDLLILATDGIHPAFEDGINLKETTRQIADKIMSRHFKGNDDALVLVVRYLGSRHE
ncbi:MAG TPA: SpoIIE family protein phosphatase [Candidatus Acidoferrales bacterium]|jgi:negative regulator of sigma-B (phosphoserine phosphatase)|nr:SpoIIE family protein phosphatase [Candidatus Acidoferrales bacterium]